ncbi:MAG: PH domain-containing protein [Planctomycetota bacterium]|nr:PH domain-containing protein [Planctomycetota bacterium]
MRSELAPNERCLHPVSLVFRVIAHARSLLLPAVAVLYLGRGEGWQAWAALFFVPILAFDVFRYRTLRWRYDADELVVRQGWIWKSERHVPYARIQNVDLKQNVLHRALKVAEVRIETAGGAEPEVSLSVVSLAAYEEVRERAFAGRAQARPAAALPSAGAAEDVRSEPGTSSSAPETILELSPLDIVLLGVHPGRGLALLAIAWGTAREFGFFEDWEKHAESAAQDSGNPEAFLKAATVLIVVAGVAGLMLLSLAASFVEYWNFRLEAEGEVFRVRRGLLTRQVQTIPRGRIQAVTVEHPWFLGLVGRARVHVRTAGGNPAREEGQRGGGRHFAPIVRRERVAEILARIRPGIDVADADWRPLGRTAPRRFLVGGLVQVLPLAALAIVFLAWYGAAIAIGLVAFTVLAARRRARRAAWARAPWGLAAREGAFSTAEHATFVDKIQAVDLFENPLDRRHGHVTVRVDTAGPLSRGGSDVSIHYLPREIAEDLRADLVGAAAASRFRW